MYERTFARSRIVTIAAAALAVLVLVACGQVVGEPGATGTPASTATPTTIVPTVEEVTATPEEPTPAPEVTTPTAPPKPSATQVVDGPGQGQETPAPGPGTPGFSTGNLWAMVLGSTYASEGWSARPCEGGGFFLCVYEGPTVVGSVEIGVYAIDTLPEFQEMLKAAGLTLGSIDYRDSGQRAKLTDALRAFVDNYHSIFEEDRRVTYRGEATYSRLDTGEVPVGELPGLRYGFKVLDKEGKSLERWVLHSAFEGEILYTIAAAYHPDTVSTFRSVDDLERFEPHLTRIVAGLKLPPPVLETEVKQIEALVELPLYRLYTESAGPVAFLNVGQTVQVTGQSPDKRWWRVVCPDGNPGSCWVTADPEKVDS